MSGLSKVSPGVTIYAIQQQSRAQVIDISQLATTLPKRGSISRRGIKRKTKHSVQEDIQLTGSILHIFTDSPQTTKIIIINDSRMACHPPMARGLSQPPQCCSCSAPSLGACTHSLAVSHWDSPSTGHCGCRCR
jgi:hypothetical protein